MEQTHAVIGLPVLRTLVQTSLAFWAGSGSEAAWQSALGDARRCLAELQDLARRHARSYVAVPELQAEVEAVSAEVSWLVEHVEAIAGGTRDAHLLDEVNAHADALGAAIAAVREGEARLPVLSPLPILNQVLIYGQNGIAATDLETGRLLLTKARNYSTQIRSWTRLASAARPPTPSQSELLARLERHLTTYDDALGEALSALTARDEDAWRASCERVQATVVAIRALRHEFDVAEAAARMRLCPRCAASTPRESEHCTSCGARVPAQP